MTHMFFAKIWPKHMYCSAYISIFCFTFFTRWPEMTLTCIMVTKHWYWYLQMSETPFMLTDSLSLFAHNNDILLFKLNKTEKSNTLTLRCPVASSVTYMSMFYLVRRVHAQCYRMAFEICMCVWPSSLAESHWAPCPPPPPYQDVLQTKSLRDEGKKVTCDLRSPM